MSARGRWLRAIVIGLLVALVIGRWLAVSTADRLWAEAVGAAASHRWLAGLKLRLFLAAFGGAVVWCVGNLYLVYRSIGSVHVPRRLANLEIVEAVPLKFLRLGAVVLGLALALSISQTADSWWHARVLANSATPLGMLDPILRHDASYYLFTLPWQRAFHGYTTLLAAVILGVVALLYVAMGAVRWTNRRIVVSELARRHLGVLLAALALVLVWGYRLEPAEYVAGVHGVMYDSILTDVRIPTANVLTAMGLLAALVSLLWGWFDRISLVAFGWISLTVFSLVGHYVVPAVAAGVRTTDELQSGAVDRVQNRFLQVAYGLSIQDSAPRATRASLPRQLTADPERFAAAPVWDSFALTVLLNRMAGDRPYFRIDNISLAHYLSPAGRPVPVFLGVREVDLDTARRLDADLNWEQVHLVPYGHALGAVAVLGDRVSDEGLPYFIGDLQRPDSVVAHVTDVALSHPEIVFGPAMTEFAIAPHAVAKDVVGIRLGGIARRLALAWKLQSPKLLVSPSVSDESVLLWYRSVVERLERYAPFAQFGTPYPVIAAGSVYWLAPGYVTAEAFPLSQPHDWMGREVRYVGASLTGVVDARTGATSVVSVRAPDPLTAAWAAAAPDIVQPSGVLPAELRFHVRYPAEFFRAQLALLQGKTAPRRFAVTGLLGASVNRVDPGAEPFWWIGGSPADTTVRLRIRSVLHDGEPPVLMGLAEGDMWDNQPSLRVLRFPQFQDLPSTAEIAAKFAAERGDEEGIAGPLKTVPMVNGLLSMQSVYLPPAGERGVPRLADVFVSLGEAVARGPTLDAALTQVRETVQPTGRPAAQWATARRWFQRLDAARRSGDWVAFGEAYEELRRLLGVGRDSSR